MKRILFHFLTILFSFSIFLLLAEIGSDYFITIRDVPNFQTIDPYSDNPYIRYRRPFIFFHIPNSTYYMQRPSFKVKYEINSLGFRGPEINSRKNKKRMIIIGDSIVEGHGVPFSSTFVTKLNESLELSEDLSVVNCGMQGASPIYFSANLERYLSVKPDIVMIHLFSNDLYEDQERESIYFKIPFLNQGTSFPGLRNEKISYLRRLKIFDVFRTLSSYIFRNSPLEKIINSNLEMVEKKGKCRKARLSESELEKRWPLSRRYLDYFVESLQKKNIMTIVVYSNFYDQNNINEYNVTKKLEWKISEWAKSRNIPFKSLLPVINELYKSTNIDKIVLPYDGHPTEKTHEVMAFELKKWLMSIHSTWK